ncbi:putative receptor-like protein kinase At5g24010 [Curcuma longa]|uniref:putative receptor-like protein kinase At5g24010 n=1 Tax=Curcuma longa TaxID=136217 RepID=UPI003D9EEB4A
MDHLFLHLLLIASLLLSAASTDFTPEYFLNCGGHSDIATDDSPSRVFVSDSKYLSSRANSLPLSNPSSSNSRSSIYSTARVFTGPVSYTFPLNSTGVHVIRLHFLPFSADARDLSAARFDVTVQHFLLLKNFSVASSATPAIKEYFLWVDSAAASTTLELNFLPVSSSFAFVNVVEVFTAPAYLFDSSTTSNLSNQTMETVYRINVGGATVTPANDTMWRTWTPDDAYIWNRNMALSNGTNTNAINYEKPDVTNVVAPEFVYSTARTMNIPEGMRIGNPNFDFNVTWTFQVDASYNYLVRAHFCDFISPTFLNAITFVLYVANHAQDIRSGDDTDNLLVPFYKEVRVEDLPSGWINISIDRSLKTQPSEANAYLNGLEIFKFNNELVNSGDSTKRRSRNVAVFASASAGGAVVLSLLVFGLILLARKRRRGSKSRPLLPNETWSPDRQGTAPQGNSVDLSINSTSAAPMASPRVNLDLNIPLLDIRAATNDFDESLEVGSGGFGKVYKGVLGDGTKVAVKRAMPGSKQGYPEFQAEILVLSKIRHRHLVSLIGYCEEQSERILVYEYMEKGPLRNYLYGISDDKPCLSWKQRLEICIGAARGLHYLHTGYNHTIIHRDIKSTNILLDKTYLAKVSDFGLSRLGPSMGETHVTTGVKGTFGYFDPEYFKTQQLTDKSDVYSFGVMLFEVLCARPVIDRSLSHEQVNLAEWALHWQRRGQLEKIIDQRLEGKINRNSLRKFGETAEKCLADYGVDRPPFADVLWNLEYALQLHVTGLKREPHEDSGAMESRVDVPEMREVNSADAVNGAGGDDHWRTRNMVPLDSSGSTVFSQLVSSEGR